MMAKKIGYKGITALWTNNGALISAGENCVSTIKRTVEWAAAANIPVVNFGDAVDSEIEVGSCAVF